MKHIYQCTKCKQVTTFHKEGYPCCYCGHPEMKEYQSLTNKHDNPFHKNPGDKTTVEYEALKHETELNRKEIMIVFKRLKELELRLETVESQLRGYESQQA